LAEHCSDEAASQSQAPSSGGNGFGAKPFASDGPVVVVPDQGALSGVSLVDFQTPQALA
tara:strand:- start:321 stop:497 length:177 start_codon:yes stop_codon:yes gene_type:complete